MRSDQGGNAYSTITPPPPPAPITPASARQGFFKSHLIRGNTFFLSDKTGHAMRFVSAGGKTRKLDKTCWR